MIDIENTLAAFIALLFDTWPLLAMTVVWFWGLVANRRETDRRLSNLQYRIARLEWIEEEFGRRLTRADRAARSASTLRLPPVAS